MLRRAGLAAIVLSLLVGVVGSAAFSSTQAERGIDVAVVDDDEAYVGYDAAVINTTDGDEERLVTVTNRFDDTINVTGADVGAGTSGNLTVGSIQRPTGIDVGDSGAIEAEINCDEVVENEAVTVTVTVEGSGVSATVFGDTESREVTVSCYP